MQSQSISTPPNRIVKKYIHMFGWRWLGRMKRRKQEKKLKTQGYTTIVEEEIVFTLGDFPRMKVTYERAE